MKLSAVLTLILFAILYWACATPRSPTGGPPDKTGPTITDTYPATGSVNFRGRSFEFEFSEWVNRASVEKELVIEPDLGLEYKTKWRRKKFIVSFEEDLPDETTIILTLGPQLTDNRGNKMGEGVRLAVSTGDEIDSGEITGRVRNANTGASQDGQKVLLYRFPATIADRATYLAEADTGGVFRFQYLRAGRYQVYAVQDRNLNKTWDPNLEIARPFNRNVFTLEKGQKDTLDVMYWSAPDTTRPRLQAVGLLSSNRLRLRFTEEIRYTNQTRISLMDTLGNPQGETFPLFVSDKDPFIGFAYAMDGTDPAKVYSLEVEGVTDNTGNAMTEFEGTFPGSAQADTVRQRIFSANMAGGLFPGDPFVVEYTGPIAQQTILDSLVVAEGEITFSDWPGIRIEGHRLIIPPQGQWIDGVDYQFLIWNPSTNRRQMFNPEIWNPIKLGGMEIQVNGSDSAAVYHLSVENEELGFRRDTTFSGILSLEDLPPVSYRLKIFQDLNGNDSWDFGTIDPYRAPEPYYVQRSVNVQQGFISEVIISF